jgi:malate synthase
MSDIEVASHVGMHTSALVTQLLPDALLAILSDLHQRFDQRRQALLEARLARQESFDQGLNPNFRTDTAHIRAGNWRVGAIPIALQDRRVEITGPTDAKMVINALNSGAHCYMADFEDSTAPNFANVLGGQLALRSAVQRQLNFTADNGKEYRLDPNSRTVLIVRPRGWHLPERHVLVNGVAMSGAIFDATVFAFHNAKSLQASDRGPYFYLPKLQCMEEATLWHEVLSAIESAVGVPQYCMKATVLIETLPAAFEMDEILFALRERIVGLNCGRWDYIFSYLKTFRQHTDKVLPERMQVTMTQPFLKAYSELLIQTCHKRGAFAMGGMAAQIPINGDADANKRAMDKVRADKEREAAAGHDGTWVAHPALIPIAREVFDRYVPAANQLKRLREDVSVTAIDLITPCTGSITRQGFEANIEVSLRYLSAWLNGQGCVPIHHLMEDAATAEISRMQLWQWLQQDKRGKPVSLEDGSIINDQLFDEAFARIQHNLKTQTDWPGSKKLEAASQLFLKLCRMSKPDEFLTLSAYAELA